MIRIPYKELCDLFSELSELPRELVIFDGDKEPHIAPRLNKIQGIVRLSINSRVQFATDETAFELDTKLTERRKGYRIVTLNVSLDSYSLESADDILETVKHRLRRRSSLQALRDLNMSLVDVPLLTALSLTPDNTTRSRATMDVRLHWTIEEELIDNEDYFENVIPLTLET